MISKEERIKNLKRASEESHKLANAALKEALYKLLKKKSINEITVTELIKTAGVSRGTYYKHYYYLTDLLSDDLDTIINGVLGNLTPSLYENWLIIFNKVYEIKDKLALIYKAGLSIVFLKKLNDYYEEHDDIEKHIVINGIFFNSVYNWGVKGFRKSPEALAREITGITEHIFA